MSPPSAPAGQQGRGDLKPEGLGLKRSAGLWLALNHVTGRLRRANTSDTDFRVKESTFREEGGQSVQKNQGNAEFLESLQLNELNANFDLNTWNNPYEIFPNKGGRRLYSGAVPLYFAVLCAMCSGGIVRKVRGLTSLSAQVFKGRESHSLKRPYTAEC